MTKAYELLQQIKDLALISGTTEDNSILRKMNLAQWDIYNAHFHWRCLEDKTSVSTVASQGYVTVPATVAQVYSLVQDTSSPYSKLTYIPPRRFQTILPQPTLYSTGKPTHYTWYAGKFWFYPIPDAVYVLSLSCYKKPLSMKIYSTGTASHTGTALTGVGTYFSDNSNVDTLMYFAYSADARSDGIYPWSTITTVTDNTHLVISAYTGTGTTGAYFCSSPSSFPEDFDTVLVARTLMLLSLRLRELEGLLSWAKETFTSSMGALIQQQGARPDYQPVLENFGPSPTILGGDYAKFPFIARDI